MANHIAIIRADPELVKLIDTRAPGIEPDRSGLGFAEFSAVGLGDERQGQAINGAAQFFSSEVDAGSDVAPLISAADLQFAIAVAAQHIKIKRLKEHVTELCIADAHFPILH